jgi:hypothetical protein
VKTGGVTFSPAQPRAAEQLISHVGHVEDLNDARTMLGKRRVLARRGWVGEKADFFSILLQRSLGSLIQLIEIDRVQPSLSGLSRLAALSEKFHGTRLSILAFKQPRC